MIRLLGRLLNRIRRVPVVAVELGLVAGCNYLAFLLRFDGRIPIEHQIAFWQSLPYLVAIRGVLFVPFRLYEGLWRYAGVDDLRAVIGSVLVSTAVFAGYVHSPLGPAAYPRAVYIIDGLLLIVSLGGLRLVRRLLSEMTAGSGADARRILVFGVNDAGMMVVKQMRQNPALGYVPIGFVDADARRVGSRIHGVRVLGTVDNLDDIIDKHDPAEILIAPESDDPAAVRRIVGQLESFKLPLKILPRIREILDGRSGAEKIRTLSVGDLLSRAPVGLSVDPIRRLIHGRRVVVTGAGGSIGSELCRQIASLRPEALVMVDRYENSLHAIHLELLDGGIPSVEAVVCDVTDEAAVGSLLRRIRPALVFHAAAHKHVPLMEDNPCEAIKNNVRGTRIVARAAEDAGVDRFIMISTDKAAKPSSVMGASKRVAELIVQSVGRGSGTSFSIVRFGNVLGSNGSVIPRFVEQIKRGGPVTVTHPDVKRFFMLIPEAVQLVLHAAAEARGGATYVLDMGEQLRVADVARNLIRLSGLTPDHDIQIRFTGLRPGEKMEEELIGVGEQLQATGVEKVFCVKGEDPVSDGLAADVAALEALAAANDRAATLASLWRLVGRDEVESRVEAPMLTAAEAKPRVLLPHRDGGICSACQKGRLHRSRIRIYERLRRKAGGRRPYRCTECGWRGWMEPVDHVGQGVVPHSGPLNLSALDIPGDPDARPAHAFSPRDMR